MCPPRSFFGFASSSSSLSLSPFYLPHLHPLNFRHLTSRSPSTIPSRRNIQPPPRLGSHQGRRSPSSFLLPFSLPRCCALYLVFPPLHPYYLLGREHKRTAMNIMSLYNLAAHATRRVVCLTRVHLVTTTTATGDDDDVDVAPLAITHRAM